MSKAQKVATQIDFSQIPSLASLMAFERAAHYLSFSKAAIELGRTPSAVSHAINELEDRFECKLFQRNGRGVILTDAGSRYVGEVRSALRYLYRGGKTLSRSENIDIIRIRVQPVFACLCLVPNLAEFEQAHPEMKLILDIGREKGDWQASAYDIEVQLADGYEERNLNVFELGAIQSVPICSPKLIEGPVGLKCIEDIAKHRLIHDAYFPDQWASWFKGIGYPYLEPKDHLILNEPVAVFEAAMSGLGVGLGLYTNKIRSYRAKGGIVLPFGEMSGAGFTYQFVTPYNFSNNGNIAVVYDWMKGLMEDF